MYYVESILKLFTILVIFLFVFLGIGIYFSQSHHKQVIKNRENYEIFDVCYEIQNHYYCEKTNNKKD